MACGGVITGTGEACTEDTANKDREMEMINCMLRFK